MAALVAATFSLSHSIGGLVVEGIGWDGTLMIFMNDWECVCTAACACACTMVWIARWVKATEVSKVT